MSWAPATLREARVPSNENPACRTRRQQECPLYSPAAGTHTGCHLRDRSLLGFENYFLLTGTSAGTPIQFYDAIFNVKEIGEEERVLQAGQGRLGCSGPWGDTGTGLRGGDTRQALQQRWRLRRDSPHASRAACRSLSQLYLMPFHGMARWSPWLSCPSLSHLVPVVNFVPLEQSP